MFVRDAYDRCDIGALSLKVGDCLTQATWEQLNDREVLCGVFPVSDEDTTGSARGIAE